MASILKSSSKGVDAKVEFVPSVIVGIDIGTARSGMSYAFTKRREEIVCSQKSDNPHLKELTAVLLRASDLGLIAFGEEAQKEYLEIDPVKQAADFLYFEKFKMVLYGDNLSERPLVTAANGKKVPSVEVFAAALSYFKTKAMKELKEATSGLLTDADVQWVVTVPAIWSPGAKQLMREASKKAGLYDKIEAQVVLALESEAASLCCRERELQVNASQWKPGLRYMVVDLGGGTADVTVHKVTDQLNLGEVVASSGGPWGSVYIDNEFIQLLAKVFGEKVVHSFWSSYPLEAIDLMSSFEHVKMSATPKDNKPRRLKLPILFIQHVQQQTGKNIESLCADFALVYKPNAPAVSVKSPTAASATGDSSKSKSEKDTKSGGSSGAPAINFLDLQPSNVAANAEAAKPSSGTGGFASSLLSHIMPGYLGSKPAPAGSPTPPTPTAAATPSTATAAAAVGASTPSAKSGDSKSAPSATAAPKKLDEWVFVGTEVPSAPGGIPASDACISWARGQLKLSAELVKSLFDPVVSKVVEHVEKVLSDVGVVSHIFMAGGFSESDFIKLAIESVIGPRGIRVITPPHAALAVLSGAVIYGLKPKVVSSRIVKRTYGVAVSTEWQQKKHSDRRKAFRSNNGKLVAFADNIFSPFCLSGDELKVDFSVTQTYTPGEDGQKVMVLRVYQSKSRAVTYIDAPDAHHVATLECPMLDLTGGMTRSVEVTMKFGATEIMVTAVDQTSGADVTCKLSFLDGSLGLDGNSKVTASA